MKNIPDSIDEDWNINVNLTQKYIYRPFVFIEQPTELEKWEMGYISIPWYSWSKTVARDLYEVVTNSKNSLVKVLSGSSPFTKSDQTQLFIDIDDIVEHNKNVLVKEIERTHRKNSTYILWISMFSSDWRTLEIIKILKAIKKSVSKPDYCIMMTRI